MLRGQGDGGRRIGLPAAVAIALLLGACGGGDSGDSTTTVSEAAETGTPDGDADSDDGAATETTPAAADDGESDSADESSDEAAESDSTEDSADETEPDETQPAPVDGLVASRDYLQGQWCLSDGNTYTVEGDTVRILTVQGIEATAPIEAPFSVTANQRMVSQSDDQFVMVLGDEEITFTRGSC